jgi:hypothetical protein
MPSMQSRPWLHLVPAALISEIIDAPSQRGLPVSFFSCLLFASAVRRCPGLEMLSAFYTFHFCKITNLFNDYKNILNKKNI